MQTVHILAMYYFQHYCYTYRPEPDQHISDPTSHALLKVAILGLALKIQF